MERKRIVVMHAMPMSSRTDDEILETRESENPRIIEIIHEYFDASVSPEHIMVIDNYTPKDKLKNMTKIKTPDLYFFGRGIKKIMAISDVVVMGDGWRLSRGCISEAAIASLYGIPVMELNGKYVRIEEINFNWKDNKNA